MESGRPKTLGPDGPRRDTTRHVDHDGTDGQGRLPREDGQGTRSMEANLTGPDNDGNDGLVLKGKRPRNKTQSRCGVDMTLLTDVNKTC